MTARETLIAAIEATAFPSERVFAVRDSPAAGEQSGATVPSIIYRLDNTLMPDETLNGPGRPLSRFYEVTCRAHSIEDAIKNASDVMTQLACTGKLTHVLSEYDDEDDPDQKAGKYFARVIVVGVLET